MKNKLIQEEFDAQESDKFWENMAEDVHYVEDEDIADKFAADDHDPTPNEDQRALNEDKVVGEEHVQDATYILTQESTVQPKPKATRSKKANPDPNMRIFHKNRDRSERIFQMKMKSYKFDEYGSRSTPDKSFDVSRTTSK